MNVKQLISSGCFSAAIVIAALCFPAGAAAVSTVAISSAGDGVFTVQGIGIEGAAAFEINVGYDTATLANPRVVSGDLVSGAMTAVNTNVAGAVRMVMIRLTPVSGNGVIATLTFDRTGTSAGKITTLAAKLVNSQGASLPALVQIQNPSEGTATASTDSQTRETPADAASTAAAPTAQAPKAQPVAPTIIIAGPSERPVEGKTEPESAGTKTGAEATTPPEPARKDEPAVITGKADGASAAGDEAARATASTGKVYLQKSVLDRFREYRGERTPEAFVALFGQESNIWCRQDPPVALSDGRTTVRVTFITTPGKKTASDIAVIGARLISLKQDRENTNTWIAEVVPVKGEYRASVAVSQGEASMVCPLTIAPPVKLDGSRSGTAAKAEFERYVRGRGAASQKQYDVNKDDKVDYIDDYIITANYLAASGKTPVRSK